VNLPLTQNVPTASAGGAAPDPAPLGARLPDTRWLPSAPLGSGKAGPQWDLLARQLALPPARRDATARRLAVKVAPLHPAPLRSL